MFWTLPGHLRLINASDTWIPLAFLDPVVDGGETMASGLSMCSLLSRALGIIPQFTVDAPAVIAQILDVRIQDHVRTPRVAQA